MVMFGFWIAHACALYHPEQPAVSLPYRIQALVDGASSGMASVGGDIPLLVIAEA
jgi:hypothetical protein